MKCIYCDGDATYVIAGQSVCLNHSVFISDWDIHSRHEFKKSPLYKKIKELEVLEK